jgi:conjugative transposon TraN protein
MKGITTFIITCCLLGSAFAQNASLSVTTAKTTSLIFPFPVKHVDMGSKNILVQQVREADNILLVKAATNQLPETNLTVITSDGSVYAFEINYKDDPLTLVWQIPAKQEANVITYANSIMDNTATVRSIHDAKYDMFARVSGIYIRKETIYYQLQLFNRSTIDFDIDYLRFTLRDHRKVKRTATQEVELRPLYIAGNIKMVKAGATNSIVVALSKFTIPDAKLLAIEIGEKDGGRNLSMRVRNRNIIRAIPLPNLK